MKEQKKARIINLANQLIEKALYEDILANGKVEDGDSWNVYHLRLLKSLIEDYFNNEK
jgi:hypothetical protein